MTSVRLLILLYLITLLPTCCGSRSDGHSLSESRFIRRTTNAAFSEQPGDDNNLLDGGAGEDTLRGGGDFVTGGGDDTAGEGNDSAGAQTGGGAATIKSGEGEEGNDTLIGGSGQELVSSVRGGGGAGAGQITSRLESRGSILGP